MPDPTRNYGAPLDPQRDYPFLYAPSTRARQSYEDLSNDFRKSTDKFSTSTKSHFKRLTDSQERMIERLRDGPDLTPIRSDPMAAPSPATNDIRRSNRLRKPNSKYEHFATATLDTALEGYQPDDDDEGTEENATYRIGGTEFACAAAALVQMALYGLNQSGHEWELHCKKQIATLGWNQSPYDPCVFTRGHGADMEMLGTYVDDFIVATPSQDKMNKIMDELSSKMNLKRQGPLHYMLGVRITRSADLRTLTMTQDAYTEKKDLMTTVVTVKLTEHNYRSWKTYFKGRLMTKGLINTITNGTSTSDIDNQKALGILIETLDPSQYRHIDGIYDATEAYKALKTHHQPNTKIDRIEVSKEWAKLNWNPRQETLPDFLH
ncbi:hypothetical protein DYB30_012501, partial [Aphanomyces astaci]